MGFVWGGTRAASLLIKTDIDNISVVVYVKNVAVAMFL